MLTLVNEGRLTLNQYVKLQSERPAQCWNLYPRKGTLDTGADGDVTIVDMNKPGVLDENKLHSKNKLSPWHGWHVTAQPVYTIIRGNIVMKDGEIAPQTTPQGEFITPTT
jgi:allantoinase